MDVTSQRTWGWDYLWQPVATLDGESLATSAESNIGGGGGGFSTIEQRPSYQYDVPGIGEYHAVQYLTPTDYTTVTAVTGSQPGRADRVELQPHAERHLRLQQRAGRA